MTTQLSVQPDKHVEYAGWYPVALSSDVPDGKVIGRDFLGTRVAVFRAGERVATVHSYCAHLGADLSIGAVKSGELECPYHHFRYGADGRCTWVPGDNEIPSSARVASYPTAERYGVIWAHNGPTPLYDLPHWPGHETAVDGELLVHVSTERLAAEPWVILANTYDYLHLQELHGLNKILTPSDIERVDDYVLQLEIDWEMPAFGAMSNHARTFGTNTNFTVTRVGETEMLVGFSATPIESGSTEVYTFAACRDTSDGDETRLQALRTQLEMTHDFVERLASDDRAVFNTLRFRAGAMLPEDRALNWFLRFVRDFPRIDVETQEVSAGV